MKLVLVIFAAIIICASAYKFKVKHQRLSIPSDESVFDVEDDESRDRRLINANNATGDDT